MKALVAHERNVKLAHFGAVRKAFAERGLKMRWLRIREDGTGHIVETDGR